MSRTLTRDVIRCKTPDRVTSAQERIVDWTAHPPNSPQRVSWDEGRIPAMKSMPSPGLA
jgi:hypothetical protein